MKLSTTAAVLALAAAQGVNAVDFDFREFEGLWENPNAVIDSVNSGLTALASVQCEATGDFRKAMCEVTAVINDSALCLDADNVNAVNAVAEGKFIMDQFDEESGETKVLMINVKCCDPGADAAAANNGCVPMPDRGIGAGMLNAQLTMLAGKSNNNVRAIDAKLGTGPSNDPFDTLEIDIQFRRTAGGFKSYN
uniref:Plastid lipid-associated protein/fibrillin conserved domain-containing protein n=1 Tax=Minutocellus polymorphus TaxID=265543 RepID=A0A6U0J4R0_9STRA|mmetsp:Transcript_1560/g.2592  ORF Transcript_1560/g.2592 Transcript_1560/m.2592 type:complete len:194 (+) Transcript_1560:81-662(+)